MAEHPHLIDIRQHSDARGSLGVLEGDDLPFAVRRVYYLFDVPEGELLGEHGHKRLEQVFLCLSGQVDVTLHDGTRTHSFVLDHPARGLRVPPGMWRSLRFARPGTVVCVLASRPYEPEDYIYSLDEFLEWSNECRAASC
ncbi:sugar 3,4-ketoisomerase [Halodurantibacterium flavum]|uniref:Sugar 3,4-ketoisomerase n=1 Tax=Halodurantibacterium flavum TaxID=1382802 RepID=A0ABW4S5Z8_9RHOB